MLTVPLLSLAGVGGTVANGTNRIAVLIQNLTGAYGFARRNVGDRARTIAVLVPVMLGAAAGSLVASQIPDDLFERIFGLLMFPLLILTLRKPAADAGERPWPVWLTFVVFATIGFYGGAVQAGVGLFLLLVLARSGFDLVTANAVKTILILPSP